ncbi:hypothetical protein LUU34_00368900 [Aix galericulata]|nr:hypothetical protein LUU34_00368900 [Aix galericulata]
MGVYANIISLDIFVIVQQAFLVTVVKLISMSVLRGHVRTEVHVLICRMMWHVVACHYSLASSVKEY